MALCKINHWAQLRIVSKHLLCFKTGMKLAIDLNAFKVIKTLKSMMNSYQLIEILNFPRTNSVFNSEINLMVDYLGVTMAEWSKAPDWELRS